MHTHTYTQMSVYGYMFDVYVSFFLIYIYIHQEKRTHIYTYKYACVCVYVFFVFYQPRSCVVVRFRYNQAVFLTLGSEGGVWIFCFFFCFCPLVSTVVHLLSFVTTRVQVRTTTRTAIVFSRLF